MKNLLYILLAGFGLAFVYSCEGGEGKEEHLKSLAGTTWKSERYYSEDEWCQDELTFTETSYSYVRKTWYGTTGGPFTGKYKFEYPTVTIQVEPWPDETYVQSTYGTVKGVDMTVDIMTGDVVWTLELKKQ